MKSGRAYMRAPPCQQTAARRQLMESRTPGLFNKHPLIPCSCTTPGLRCCRSEARAPEGTRARAAAPQTFVPGAADAGACMLGLPCRTSSKQDAACPNTYQPKQTAARCWHHTPSRPLADQSAPPRSYSSSAHHAHANAHAYTRARCVRRRQPQVLVPMSAASDTQMPSAGPPCSSRITQSPWPHRAMSMLARSTPPSSPLTAGPPTGLTTAEPLHPPRHATGFPRPPDVRRHSSRSPLAAPTRSQAHRLFADVTSASARSCCAVTALLTQTTGRPAASHR